MSNLPSIATVSLSSQLRAATEPESRAVYSEGFALVESWSLPARITAELIGDAVAALPALDGSLMPADRQTVERWLIALGTLCAGNLTAADARVKVMAYARLIDHPGACFTEATLRVAGKAFKWLPSFAELSAFLDEQAKPQRDLRARVERLARSLPTTGAEPKPKRYRDMTPSERTKVDGHFRTIKEVIADAQRTAPGRS